MARQVPTMTVMDGPSVRGQGPLRGRGRGRGRGGGRSRRGRGADGARGGATGRAHGGAVGADGSSANVAQIDTFRSDRHVCQNVLVAHLYHAFLQLPFSGVLLRLMGNTQNLRFCLLSAGWVMRPSFHFFSRYSNGFVFTTQTGGQRIVAL
jgi:hypothetical protein